MYKTTYYKDSGFTCLDLVEEHLCYISGIIIPIFKGYVTFERYPSSVCGIEIEGEVNPLYNKTENFLEIVFDKIEGDEIIYYNTGGVCTEEEFIVKVESNKEVLIKITIKL